MIDLRGAACPTCGSFNDRQVVVTEQSETPTPGDFTICSYCSSIGVYTESGVRAPSQNERIDALRDPLVRRAQERVREELLH